MLRVEYLTRLILNLAQRPLVEIYETKLSFKPTLNLKSLQMAADRDSSAALTEQKKLTARQREYLESKEEPLSFRPKINRNYKDA